MKKILMTLMLTASTVLLAQDTMGGLVGGAIGGVIGNQFGGGSGKVAATIAGATLGTMIGSDNQRVYQNTSYNREYDYPTTRVIYREAPSQIVYTQPRVVYIDSTRHYDHGYKGHGHHHKKYARSENYDRYYMQHDDDHRCRR